MSHQDYNEKEEEWESCGGDCSVDDSCPPLLPTVSLDASEALDRIAVMLRQERSDMYRCVDYFSSPPSVLPAAEGDSRTTKPPVDAECRTKMWQWCTQIVDFCQFSRRTVSVAMALLDRFLTTSMTRTHPHPRAVSARLSRKEFQLAAMTALYTAVKLNEPVEMDTELVSEVSRGCYSAKEIADMELDMLEALGWSLSGPTPLEFVGHFLALLPRQRGASEQQQAEAILLELGRRQTELAASDLTLVVFHPSTIAVAALINSLEAIDNTIMSPVDKLAFLRTVREATGGIDVTGEEMYFARSRLFEAIADLGQEEDEDESSTLRHQEQSGEPAAAEEKSKHVQKPEKLVAPVKRRCSETGATASASGLHCSPVCISESE